MARTQTMVQLTDELLVQLDDEAARRHISRSALIREAVEQLLATYSEQSAVQRLVESYRAVPATTPDAWGDLAAAADVATRETMQRLDAEEAAAGLEPW